MSGDLKDMFGAKMNRQPGPIKEGALQMLRDKGLKKFTKVVSSDDEMVGDVVYIRLRLGDADVDLKLYEAYLDVATLDLGTHFYVPTDFVAEYDPDEAQIKLSVPFAVVQVESWDRKPDFIARHLDKVEELE